MRKLLLKIENPMGFHARPVTKLYLLSEKYQCSIRMLHNDREADIRDMLAVMGLGIKYGDKVILQFDGSDEEEAEKAVLSIVDELNIDN